MASGATFSGPCLVAILLVCHTRTGSGAQILFHYPPRLSKDDEEANHQSGKSSVFGAGAGDISSTSSDESNSDDDNDFALPEQLLSSAKKAHNPAANNNYAAPQSATRNGAIVPEEDGGRAAASAALSAHQQEQQHATLTPPSRKHHQQQAEQFFGFREDGLVSLLSPDRAWHKRKFELGINDLTFVGRPVFVRPDGTWRSRQRHRKPPGPANDDPSASDTATDKEDRADAEHATTTTSTTTTDRPAITANDKSPLTMFHVVFVMNPPPLEHAAIVKDMYDNVIKKFSKALKWEQVHHDYVWKEIEIIATVRASHSAERSSASKLCTEIQSKSSLANAIATVFMAISTSRIAQVLLSPKVSFSLQIPPVTSISSLPSLTDPPVPPGLWLTTATDLGSTGTESETAEPGQVLQLAKHYTLLLKSHPHRIAKDALEAGGQLAADLPKFVSALRPTKSFHKLFTTSQMSLKEIQILAHHLIYWRRAVAIPPLHQRDVYIVSPNADLSKLREATKHFEQQFAQTMPNMPSLPRILSDLSGIPRPFGSLIPSTDHKENYYAALAWLMRDGWVTQLRTFMYIRVDPEVKSAVREQGKLTTRTTTTTTTTTTAAATIPEEPSRTPVHAETATGQDNTKTRVRPTLINRPSSEVRKLTNSDQPVHSPHMASIILNPPRALEVESKWLDYIKTMLVNGRHPSLKLSPEDRDELQKYWPMFVKYFNGHVAMETIPVREGLKRRFVWNLLGKVGLDLDSGVEDAKGTNKAILIPVRHW